MEAVSWSGIIADLGISAAAIVALVFVSYKFIEHLSTTHNEHRAQFSKMHESHLAELKEREGALRETEREVRTSITEQLTRNTHVMSENNHLMDQVLNEMRRK